MTTFPDLEQPAVQNRGFSLVELMVVIVVAGLLLAMGLPAFQSVGRSLRQREVREELRERLRTARQSAVTRHCPVIMGFGNGVLTTGITTYSVHIDLNSDRLRQAAEPFSAYTLQRSCSMNLSGFSPVDTVIFDLSGALWPGTTGGRFFLLGANRSDTLALSGTGTIYRP